MTRRMSNGAMAQSLQGGAFAAFGQTPSVRVGGGGAPSIVMVVPSCSLGPPDVPCLRQVRPVICTDRGTCLQSWEDNPKGAYPKVQVPESVADNGRQGQVPRHVVPSTSLLGCKLETPDACSWSALFLPLRSCAPQSNQPARRPPLHAIEKKSSGRRPPAHSHLTLLSSPHPIFPKGLFQSCRSVVLVVVNASFFVAR